jgi:hypothetical protein
MSSARQGRVTAGDETEEEEMRHRLIAGCVVVLALEPLAVGPASAQPWVYQPPLPGQRNRPLLSPYLNLIRNFGDPAINYYLGTLPEQQRRQNDFFFRRELNTLETRIRPEEEKPGEEPVGPPPTGQPSSFVNTQKRFNDTAGYFPPVALPPTPGRRPAIFL